MSMTTFVLIVILALIITNIFLSKPDGLSLTDKLSLILIFAASAIVFYVTMPKGAGGAEAQNFASRHGFSVAKNAKPVELQQGTPGRLYGIRVQGEDFKWIAVDVKKNRIIIGDIDMDKDGAVDFRSYSNKGLTSSIYLEMTGKSDVLSAPSEVAPNSAYSDISVYGNVALLDDGERKVIKSELVTSTPASFILSPEAASIISRYPGIPEPKNKTEERLLVDTFNDIEKNKPSLDDGDLERFYSDNSNPSSTGKSDAESVLLAAHEFLSSDDFPHQTTVVYPSKLAETKDVITVFSDPTCSVCRSLHFDIERLNKEGYEVRYFLFPRSQIQSDGSLQPNPQLADLMQKSLCSIEQHEAIDDLFKNKGSQHSKEYLPSDCSNGVLDVRNNYELGRVLVAASGGTPLLFSKNGYISNAKGFPPGYEGYEALVDSLKKLEKP